MFWSGVYLAAASVITPVSMQDGGCQSAMLASDRVVIAEKHACTNQDRGTLSGKQKRASVAIHPVKKKQLKREHPGDLKASVTSESAGRGANLQHISAGVFLPPEFYENSGKGGPADFSNIKKSAVLKKSPILKSETSSSHTGIDVREIKSKNRSWEISIKGQLLPKNRFFNNESRIKESRSGKQTVQAFFGTASFQKSRLILMAGKDGIISSAAFKIFHDAGKAGKAAQSCEPSIFMPSAIRGREEAIGACALCSLPLQGTPGAEIHVPVILLSVNAGGNSPVEEVSAQPLSKRAPGASNVSLCTVDTGKSSFFL